jgi:hypothetical protein
MLRTVLLIILILLVIGMLPLWPHTATLGWGYGPSGALGLILVILVVLVLLGHI